MMSSVVMSCDVQLMDLCNQRSELWRFSGVGVRSEYFTSQIQFHGLPMEPRRR